MYIGYFQYVPLLYEANISALVTKQWVVFLFQPQVNAFTKRRTKSKTTGKSIARRIHSQRKMSSFKFYEYFTIRLSSTRRGNRQHLQQNVSFSLLTSINKNKVSLSMIEKLWIRNVGHLTMFRMKENLDSEWK